LEPFTQPSSNEKSAAKLGEALQPTTVVGPAAD